MAKSLAKAFSIKRDSEKYVARGAKCQSNVPQR